MAVFLKAKCVLRGTARLLTAICMKPSIIVWDLETVPDLGGFAVANDLIAKSDLEEYARRSVINFRSISTTRLSALSPHRTP